ncbi:hypothetical protein [Streptomyces megasporus]|uniref:hypothetical protein n=1 Tax=Streptomyces megasporus TaxID=44060 RepID=UPI000A4700F7|nr:hypothetical protein [Streptomyces megasporus]
MTPALWPDGPYCPAQEEVNDRIRHLMEQPADEQRAEEYARLLHLWAETSQPCRYVRAA